MTEEKLQNRVSMMSQRLEDLKKSVSRLSEELSEADSPEHAFSLARQLGDAKQDISVTEEVIAQAREAVRAEQDRKQSPEFKQALRDMDKLRADNTKKAKAIDKSYQALQEQIDELHGQCKDYDRLRAKYLKDVMPIGSFNSYSWISILKSKLDSLAHDYIYLVRKT